MVKTSVLVVINMQNDYVEGLDDKSKNVVNEVVNEIKKNNSGDNYVIRDTRDEKFCVEGTEGWNLSSKILSSVATNGHFVRFICSRTLGCEQLVRELKDREESVGYIVLTGIYSDRHILTNALMLKTAFPELNIYVKKDSCVGTDAEMHKKTMEILTGCGIEVI